MRRLRFGRRTVRATTILPAMDIFRRVVGWQGGLIDSAVNPGFLMRAAKLLGVSTAPAERYWAYARAWLHQEMIQGNQEASTS